MMKPTNKLDWKEYREERGATSHAYDEDKAQEVFESIPAFLEEAKYLLAKLQERNNAA
jgi:phosphoserine phosphatase